MFNKSYILIAILMLAGAVLELILRGRGSTSGSMPRISTVNIINMGSSSLDESDSDFLSSAISSRITATDPIGSSHNFATNTRRSHGSHVREVIITVNLLRYSPGIAPNSVPLAGFSLGEPLRSEIFLSPLTISTFDSESPIGSSLFDNTVHFWSPISPVNQKTNFGVYKDGVFISNNAGYMYEMPTSNSAWSYSTLLCPILWKHVSRDPGAFSMKVPHNLSTDMHAQK